MASIGALRGGIKGRLQTIDGLHVYSRWPSQLNLPCAIVDYTAGEPDQTLGRSGLAMHQFTVELLYPLSGGWENAQDRLELLLATSSTGGVYGAIAGDRTLGSVAHGTFLHGLPAAYERRIIDENTECLAATVTLEVWAS